MPKFPNVASSRRRIRSNQNLQTTLVRTSLADELSSSWRMATSRRGCSFAELFPGHCVGALSRVELAETVPFLSLRGLMIAVDAV